MSAPQERIDIGRHRMKILRAEMKSRGLKAPAVNRLFVEAAAEELSACFWRSLSRRGMQLKEKGRDQ